MSLLSPFASRLDSAPDVCSFWLTIAGANVVEQQLLKATIEALVVERPDPTEVEQNLSLDKGDDNPHGREAAVEAGHTPHIRRIGEETKSCDRS